VTIVGESFKADICKLTNTELIPNRSPANKTPPGACFSNVGSPVVSSVGQSSRADIYGFTATSEQSHLNQTYKRLPTIANSPKHTTRPKTSNVGHDKPTSVPKKPRNRRFVRRAKPKSNSHTVVNLSNKPLTDSETSLLSKGLGFCPKPDKVNKTDLLEDMDSFYRRLRLCNHFYDDSYADDSVNESEAVPAHTFKKKSTWQPKTRDPTVECFIKAVNADVESFRNSHDVRDNLSKQERNAFDSLKLRDDIVIKKADKGSAVVVMDKAEYIEQANEHLSDTKFYTKLDHDPTSEITQKVTDTIDDLFQKDIIDQNTHDYLIPEKPTAARFYTLPKIHKPGNPIRPVVSTINHPTENCSEYLDYNLQPLAQSLPSYIKDTTHFLNRLKSIQDIPTNCILVSLDVKALYTNIPQTHGITACREALDKREIKSPPTNELIHLLELALTSNNFVFNDENYLQVSGTAIGAKFAPSYANIFMGWHEHKLLTTASLKPLVWYRYIDDIFMLWTHSEGDLVDFITHANSIHPSIQFTSQHSTSEIPFLDVMVKMSGSQLQTDLYSKPTDKHTYLLPTSCHPRHCSRNIPYSLALRLRRICSDEDTFNEQAKNLTQQLKNRGYKGNLISDQISKAASVHREDSLQYKTKSKSNRIPLVVTYHPRLPYLDGIIRKHWSIINSHPRLHKAFPELPIISYRRPPNLKDSLVRAKVNSKHKLPSTPESSGCRPCQKPRCKNCAYIQTTNIFKNKSQTTCFDIRQESTCATNNVVYLIECNICGIQYVGETGNAIRQRMCNHRSTVKHAIRHMDKPVAAHFSLPGHSVKDIKGTVIECLGSQSKFRRQHREKFWIATLDTIEPNGLNLIE
jgi:hypothetical protein